MKNSRSNKIFNLAVTLTEYNQDTSYQPINLSTDNCNLFRQQTPEKQSLIKIQQIRTFDYVGVRQLKASYQRARKTSKKRDTFQINFGYSRSSVNSIKEPQFYSKNQILEKFEQNEHKNEVHMSTIKSQDISGQENSKVIEPFISKNENLLTNIPRSKFSLQKLKRSHQNYKDLWLNVQRKCILTKGFPSIMKSVNEQRQKCLAKQKNRLNFLKQNINSRMWENILRENKQLKSIYNNRPNTQLKVVSKNNLILVGKNKLNSQKKWIEVKGNQGYSFKYYQTELPV